MTTILPGTYAIPDGSTLVVPGVTPPPVGVVPAFPPPGGVGANVFDFDASTMEDGPLVLGLFGYWYNNAGSMNNVKLSASNVAIKGGLLVLSLSAANGPGAAVTTAPWMGSPNGPVLVPKAPWQGTWTGGFRETRWVVPGNSWAAGWDTGQTWPADGEGDGFEQSNGWCTNYHATGVNQNNRWPVQPPAGTTVTVGIAWVPGVSYTSFLNGVPMVTIKGSFVATAPHCLILNIGAGVGPDALSVAYDRVWLPA